MKQQELFPIGYITKTKGLKGEIQLYFQVNNPEAYQNLESVFIEINNKPVPFFISKLAIQKNVAYIYLEDIDHVDKAVKLLKKTVYIAASKKPKESKEFTLADLKGFFVVDETEGDLGLISEVKTMPSQTLASVVYKNTEILFPLNEQFMKNIDTKERILYVRLPDGLLDVYLG